MKKKYIVVTGGAGFIGFNLIEYFLEKTNFTIISIDNYSSGNKSNHIKSKRVIYLKSETKDIRLVLNKYKKSINSLFHFGEISRIYQSFNKFNECFQSNSIGTREVFKLVSLKKILILSLLKLILVTKFSSLSNLSSA